MQRSSRSGFTLVEMAIVLAVIGLLIGSIVGSQALLRSGRVKSVGMDIVRYQSAAKTFRDRFKSLPGDMPNATSIWGSAGGTGSDATCTNTNSQGAITTCNGNGNGKADTTAEGFRFWQHLTNAGMIEGNYTGTKGTAGATDHVVGTNCPALKIAAAGIGVRYSAATIGATYFNIAPNNMFHAGGQTVGAYPTTGVFTPAELQMLDTKLDDGIAGRGHFIGGPWAACTAASSNTDYSAAYALSRTGNDCVFFWINAF
jgi:prepilin-type N-terminal cleavage/methylation domain-containing protein